MNTVGVGIIGFGFMGKTHLRAFEGARAAGSPCEVRAVYDRDIDSAMRAAAGNIRGAADPSGPDLSRLATHSKVETLLADPNVDLAVVCTYTDTHVDFALRALAAGKHVLVEKPVAISSGAADRLAAAAESSAHLICMPAMCMRFWPAWVWLKEKIDSGEFGPVRSATFQRLGAGPSWGAAFYRDEARSGGAMFDLHIHDVDFLTWVFGKPGSVASAGTLNHVSTVYRFGGPLAGVPVLAEGGWDLAPTAGFRMKFLVNFERASAEFSIGSTPELMLHEADGTHVVQVAGGLGYDHQARHIIDAIANKSKPVATCREAVEVLRVLEAERESQRRAQAVAL